MARLAALWWRMARRTSGEVAGTGIVALLVFVLQGFYTLWVASNVAAYFGVLFATALAVALLLPLAFGGNTLLDGTRLRLLPYDGRQLLWIRLALGNVPRSVALLIVLLWGVAGLALLHAPAIGRVLGIVQLAGIAAFGLLLVQCISDLGVASSRRPRRGRGRLIGTAQRTGHVVRAIALLAAIGGALAAIQLLADFGSVWRDTRELRSIATRHAGALAFAPGTPAASRAVDAFLPWVLFALLIPIAVVAAERTAQPRVSASPGRSGSRTIRILAARIAPRHRASVHAAMAMLFRTRAMRVGWGFTILVLAAGWFLPIPALLILGFAFWAELSHNMLGPDLPLSGTLRFDLAGYSPERVMRVRHRTILVIILATCVVLAPIAAATVPWFGFRARALALVFAVGWFGVACVTGRSVSFRFAKPIPVRRLVVYGGYVHPIAILSLFIVSIIGATAFAVGFGVATLLAPAAGGLTHAASALGIGGLVLLAIAVGARAL